MLRTPFAVSTLVALVSVPGFLVGQKLRQGDPTGALVLAVVMMMVIALASAIMRQGDSDSESD